MLDEALPKLFADNSAKLAEVNRQIEEFKTRTGLDPRIFDELALGMTYSYPSEGVTKINTLAIANGNFTLECFGCCGTERPLMASIGNKNTRAGPSTSLLWTSK